MAQPKIPVSMRALVARINRKLAADDMRLKIAKGKRMRQAVGDYYVINTRINAVMHHYKDCNPADLARELGVLRGYEKVVAE